MSGTKEGVFSTLSKLRKKITDRGQCRIDALNAVLKISAVSENKLLCASAELGLLPVLVEVIKEDKGDARISALGVVQNIAHASENQILCGSAELGLLPVLAEVIREDKDQARIIALGAVDSIACAAENNIISVSAELGLLPVLMEVIREDKGEARIFSLRAVCNIAKFAEYQILYVFAKLGLLPVLVEVIMEDKGEARKNALLAVESIAYAPKNKILCASAELGLLPLLLEVIREDKGEARIVALDVFCQIACPENRTAFSFVEVPFIAALSETLKSDDSAVCTLWNYSEYYGADCVSELIKSDIPALVVEKLREVEPSVAAWGERKEILSEMLNFAMNFARYAEAVDPMISLGYLEIVRPILADPANGCERLKAMYVLTFLTGKDEQSRYKSSVAVEHPDIISRLADVLKNTLNGVDGEDHQLGTFCLRLTINACQVLSISDSNKELLLATPQLLSLLILAVRMFVDGDPPIECCGGGGDDVEAVELAVSTLAQLSFYYDDDAALVQKYTAADKAVLELLSRFSTHSKVGDLAIENAKLLLGRLTVSSAKKVEEDVTPTKQSSSTTDLLPHSSGGAASHIMLSYCWNPTAKPELVKQLHTQLVARGYDVWLDAVGSSLVAPMAGSTDERMAEALEAAQVVVVCVSRIYKERPNCRMEAKYANHLYKKGKLQILYVMMQQDYTTVSEPHCCDGWLGIQIGDALWYPLWGEDMVASTVDCLQTMIGSKCKLDASRMTIKTTITPAIIPAKSDATRPVSPEKIPMPAKLRNSVSEAASPTETPVDTREELCKKAFNILTDPKKVKSITDVNSYLEELGVVEAADLEDCDKDHLLALSAMLKPVPQKKFNKLMLDA